MLSEAASTFTFFVPAGRSIVNFILLSVFIKLISEKDESTLEILTPLRTGSFTSDVLTSQLAKANKTAKTAAINFDNFFIIIFSQNIVKKSLQKIINWRVNDSR